MKFPCFAGLRVRMASVILLAILPMLGLTLATYLEERKLVMAHIRDDMHRTVSFIAHDQEQLFDRTRQLLITLVRLPEIRGYDSASCRTLLARLLQESPGYYSNLGVIDVDGKVLCSAVPVRGGEGFSGQSWFERSIETNSFAMGTCPVGSEVREPALIMSYPVHEEGDRVRGIAFAALDLTQVNLLMSRVEAPKDARFTLLSQSGMILGCYPDPEGCLGRFMQDTPLVSVVVRQGMGTAEIKDSDGTLWLYAFAPLSSSVDTGLYVILGLPLSLVYSAATRILIYHFVGLCLVALLALYMVWLGTTRFILNPVNILIRTALQLSGGDMTARTGFATTNGELERLARVFDEMAGALERRAVQLRESEERFRLLVECVRDYAIFMLDPEGHVASWNTGAQRLKGYRAAEVVGLNHACFYKTEDVERGVPEQELNRARTDGWFESEGWRIRQDGTPFWAGVFITMIVDKSGRSIGFSCITRDLTERKQADQQLAEYQEQLRSLASQLLLAEERERRRIAVNLHDRVGQALALSNIKLGALRQQESSAEFSGLVDEISNFIEQAIQETRTLIFEISSPILYELGLEAAIRHLTDQLEKQHGIVINHEDDQQPKPLDNDMRVLLFQTVSELLVNVVKHARALHVTVGIRREEGQIRLSVRDDGIGFEVPGNAVQQGAMGGFGLFSIRERLKHVGGVLLIESQRGRGTLATLVAPLRLRDMAPASTGDVNR